MSWTAALGERRTDRQLIDRRKAAVEAFDIAKFTCDDCRDRWTCDWSFDPYNTDGDCLAEK